MKVIRASDIHQAYRQGMRYLFEYGTVENSRNGKVVVAPTPVTTMFLNPSRRVMTDPTRDCNPFFHMMETIWMFAGRKDVAFVSQFNKRMAEYSDDGWTLNAAYGHRWRQWFGRDQLVDAYNELYSNPDSRRCVISMWDPRDDGGWPSKDFPCNTHIYFRAKKVMKDMHVLDMTVCNRSNDIYWGLYGANAVHLSCLHELMANSLGMGLGTWYQVSNNYHIYPDNLPKPFEVMVEDLMKPSVNCASLYNDPLNTYHTEHPVGGEFVLQSFLRSCERFCNHTTEGYGDSGFRFLDNVAFPMYRLWETRDMFWAEAIQDDIWKQACVEWLERRTAK